MAIRLYKAYSPGTRWKSVSYFGDLSKVEPEKSLTFGKKACGGRNNRGVITARGRGGGHKRKYRIIEFRRQAVIPARIETSLIQHGYNLSGLRLQPVGLTPRQIEATRRSITRNDTERAPKMRALGRQYVTEERVVRYPNYVRTLSARVLTIEYDPNRNARIALIDETPTISSQKTGLVSESNKKYILAPRSLKVGMEVSSGPDAPIEVGNALPLKFIPLGSIIHNVELTLGKGGQLARAAGTYAQLVASEGDFVTLKLPSKEVRLVNKECYATIGQVGNIDSINVTLGKAGRSRWLGRKPKVRGVVKNPNDHPHGGGEGRSPIGRPKPLTPWGKSALGVKTRNQKKASSKYILRRR